MEKSGEDSSDSEVSGDKSQEVELSKSAEESSDSEVDGDKSQEVEASKSAEESSDSEVGAEKSQEVQPPKSTDDSSDSEVGGGKSQEVEASKSTEDSSNSEVSGHKSQDAKKEQNSGEIDDNLGDSENVEKLIENADGSQDETKSSPEEKNSNEVGGESCDIEGSVENSSELEKQVEVEKLENLNDSEIQEKQAESKSNMRGESSGDKETTSKETSE